MTSGKTFVHNQQTDSESGCWILVGSKYSMANLGLLSTTKTNQSNSLPHMLDPQLYEFTTGFIFRPDSPLIRPNI
jgi:hypothetical protein